MVNPVMVWPRPSKAPVNGVIFPTGTKPASLFQPLVPLASISLPKAYLPESPPFIPCKPSAVVLSWLPRLLMTV